MVVKARGVLCVALSVGAEVEIVVVGADVEERNCVVSEEMAAGFAAVRGGGT